MINRIGGKTGRTRGFRPGVGDCFAEGVEGDQFETLRRARRVYVTPLPGRPGRWMAYAAVDGWDWPVPLWGEDFAGEKLLPCQKPMDFVKAGEPGFSFEGTMAEVERGLKEVNPDVEVGFLLGWAAHDAEGDTLEIEFSY